ncbi:hypothetical protein FF38_07647 [Lucilia cuprina]|uniref:Uncharacterized protein n=1 Tax=Lucilia cuprina TaxID=7375 RepID=A0A0L0C2T5_LUCCU|nr:hypothetical protein FF38_07647 [Lucilia cuprina]
MANIADNKRNRKRLCSLHKKLDNSNLEAIFNSFLKWCAENRFIKLENEENLTTLPYHLNNISEQNINNNEHYPPPTLSEDTHVQSNNAVKDLISDKPYQKSEILSVQILQPNNNISNSTKQISPNHSTNEQQFDDNIEIVNCMTNSQNSNNSNIFDFLQFENLISSTQIVPTTIKE